MQENTDQKKLRIKHFSRTDDYQFIIKELANEFEGPFERIGRKTVKYIKVYLNQ